MYEKIIIIRKSTILWNWIDTKVFQSPSFESERTGKHISIRYIGLGLWSNLIIYEKSKAGCFKRCEHRYYNNLYILCNLKILKIKSII